MSENTNSALLDAVCEAALDAIVMVDADGVIQRANPAATQLFGYTVAELRGTKFAKLMPPETTNEHSGSGDTYLEIDFQQIVSSGREGIGRRKDGTTFPLQISVGKADSAGESSFVAIMHDLSQRRVDQASLARSQRLDAIGQMTGGIAHDFNNLLAVIIGNLELLAPRLTATKEQNLLGDALEAAELGADLTSRLLVFARKSDLKLEPLDLREICRSTIDLLKTSLGPRYRVEERFDTDLDHVLADKVQLQSAMVNLAMNARDAMPDGGTLSCSISNFEVDDSYMAQEIDVAQGSYVRLSLSDTGGGMAPVTREQAFEPFFTTKPAGKGTGLGLAMVHGFVRQSGGHVTLYSEVGKGTTVSLYFPTVEHHAVSDGDEAKPRIKGGDGQTILVVEDDENVRRLSVERINDLGFVVIEAATADDAWAMLQSGIEVDLVFTDLMMPGDMDGRELAGRIGEDYPEIKVLLTSGYAQELVNNGHIPLLRKPFRQAELAEKIQALLRGD